MSANGNKSISFLDSYRTHITFSQQHSLTPTNAAYKRDEQLLTKSYAQMMQIVEAAKIKSQFPLKAKIMSFSTKIRMNTGSQTLNFRAGKKLFR